MLNRTKKTFTKKCMKVILSFSILDLQLSYILAFMGRVEIAEDLSKVIVTEIIGVMVAYFMKSYFETKESEKVRLVEREMESEIDE